MSREEEDERLFSDPMESDRSAAKPSQLPPEVREEILGSMTRLETMMKLEKQGLQSLKELLFSEQLPSLNAAASIIESAVDQIDPLLSSEDDGLSEKRNRFLNRVGDLARTFYHSSLTTYLRMGSVASSIFAEEFNRAYWRGVSLRETILSDLRTILDNFQPLFEAAEQLRLYQGMLSFAFNPNLTNSIQQLAQKTQTMVTLEVSETLEPIFELIQEFIRVIDQVIANLRALQGASLDPLIEIISAESNGVEKVFDIVQHSSDTQVRKLKETELGQTCDVISWGLDDKTSVEDLLEIGREYGAELLRYKEQLDNTLSELFELFEERWP